MSDETETEERELGDFSHVENIPQRKFLTAYSVTGSVCRSAKAAKISRRTHVNWMHQSPGYPELFAEAKEAAGEALEDEARRRAIEGVRKPVIYQGKQVEILNEETGKMEKLWEHEYSDTMLAMLLNGNLPEKFKQRSEAVIKQEVKHTHELIQKIYNDPESQRMAETLAARLDPTPHIN